MAPTPLDCPKAGCEWKTPVNCPDWDKMIKLQELHVMAEHGGTAPQATGGSSAPKLERLPRPSFQLEMSQAEWAFKHSQWTAYISQTPVSELVKVQQLRAACDEDLLRRVYDAGDLASMDTEILLMAQVKKIAVRVIHKTRHLQNMWAMIQSPEESVRAFASRLVGTAELCDLFITCSKVDCTQRTSYRDEVVMQALLRGMHDGDIRTRVLSRTQNEEIKTLPSVIDYIAAEEASSASFSSLSTTNTIAGSKSSYKKQHSYQTDKGDQTKCKYCGGKHPGDQGSSSRQQHCKAYNKTCTNCERLHHFASVCRSPPKTAAAAGMATTTDTVTGALLTDTMASAGFYAMQTVAPTSSEQLSPYIAALRADGPVTTVPLPHLVHTVHAGWLVQAAQPSPNLLLDVKIDRSAYGSLCLPVPRTSLRPTRSKQQRSCADSGAQLTTVPITLLTYLGVSPSDLLPIATNLNTVTGAPVDLVGGIFLEFSGVNHTTGVACRTKQLAYVSSTIPYTFLSREACVDMGLIHASFPSIGSCHSTATLAASTTCTNTGVSGPDEPPCSCPLRQPPPTNPPVLPCDPTEENLPLLRQYILDRYAASSFNTCEHQPLPLMRDSPPLRLFVAKGAKPVAVHSPAAVPKHWEAQVQAGIERDVRLGVLERVPVNTPTSWVSRMIITPKSDGSPRRVVDFQAVNEHCPRQTHHTQSPWQIASAVPPSKTKTVLDAWHGYHSVPIHPQDRHITTFITKAGRFRYRTAPQGLVSAGDGYTQRSDEIIGDFPNHLKCVDDSIIWGDDIRANFWATCAFLDKCGAGGIIFNKKKFQFACNEINFLGFHITRAGIRPTDDFIENIRSFPLPKTITDARSWFGCVQQVAYTFTVSEIMLPFRQLLRPQVPFAWSEELDKAFTASKEEIIRQCERGVRLFSMTAPTGLATDWSKSCMGWWLVQKQCTCPGTPVLGCCKTGWQTVFCGSKFNSPAESRYPPIEGEAAALVLGLDKCSHFILGHPNLLVAVDHKPLVKIFGPATLESIPNPRLFSLKQKSLRYRFTPCHVAGKKNVVPDTFSRRHDVPQQADSISNVDPGYSHQMGPPDWVSPPLLGSYTTVGTLVDTEEFIQGMAMSQLEMFNNPPEAILANLVTQPLQAVTWDMLEAACRSCKEYQLLLQLVEQGAPESSKDWDQLLLPYYRHRHLLTTIGPVILVNDRPLIPKSLRARVIDHIHSGHPGLSTMCQRLSSSLYWPDYRQDLTRSKLNCSTCMQIAPSNPAMPPRPPVSPLYPFQSIVCDFFTVAGQTYAALADRYSNWLTVLKLKRDTSAELINTLRDYFATYGVAELLSTDGASIFTSSMFSDFCKRWGVEQRISSAYHPISNKRAELAVKHAKRLVKDSLGPGGTLNTDSMARALLAHRNTPDPTTGLSPAQVVYGRVVRDFLPASPGRYMPRAEWRLTAEQREVAYSKRHIRAEEVMSAHSKQLPALQVQDAVSIQDQKGHTHRRWSKTGRVMEVLEHDSYMIKVDGSNRLTKRNRQFLRKLSPYQAEMDEFRPLPPPTVPNPIIDSPDPLEDQLQDLSTPSNLDTLPPVPVEAPPHGDHLPHRVPDVPAPAPQLRPLPKHLKERWFVNPDLLKDSGSEQNHEQACLHCSLDTPATAAMHHCKEWDLDGLREDSPTLSRRQVTDLFKFIIDSMMT